MILGHKTNGISTVGELKFLLKFTHSDRIYLLDINLVYVYYNGTCGDHKLNAQSKDIDIQLETV